MRSRGIRTLTVSLLIGAASASLAAERSFTVVNVEYEGSRVLVPATLVVELGDHVKIKVVNNIKGEPNQHGLSIPDFKVEKVVPRGEPQEVDFDAARVGVFPIQCQLHTAHVGGQLVVLPAAAKTAK